MCSTCTYALYCVVVMHTTGSAYLSGNLLIQLQGEGISRYLPMSKGIYIIFLPLSLSKEQRTK
ncbi:hypothetical protein F5Y12DRAFT_723754 [Xylaria sp. FL1777]|nr:hypothetical protein F5Y12DRAFT_723754 [Xylaria sp. FL1777]